MAIDALSQIDWQQPWLAPWRDVGQQVAQGVQQGLTVHQALNAQGGAPVRFVPQSDLPAGVAYEAYIYATQCCPTRDGLHDFFNGLVWLRFPQSKKRLNQLQAWQIAADGIGSVRGPLRDALTLFDENAAIWLAPSSLWQALRERDWQNLFTAQRLLWAQSTLCLFGHAAMEKLVCPRKSITVHVYVDAELAPPSLDLARDQDCAVLDQWLAQTLAAPRLSQKPYLPLPVMGVPGWWSAEQGTAFYADPQVFRPLRKAPKPHAGIDSDC